MVVTTKGRERVLASTYVAPPTASDPVAFAWYKRFIVEGAREHDLPAPYVEILSQLPERPDPNRLSPEPIS